MNQTMLEDVWLMLKTDPVAVAMHNRYAEESCVKTTCAMVAMHEYPVRLCMGEISSADTGSLEGS